MSVPMNTLEAFVTAISRVTGAEQCVGPGRACASSSSAAGAVAHPQEQQPQPQPGQAGQAGQQEEARPFRQPIPPPTSDEEREEREEEMQRILQSVPPEYRNLPETRLMLTKMVRVVQCK